MLLVEATGCMGGMGTSGLVTAFDPMANGERMLVGGLMREIVETLFKTGGLGPNVTDVGYDRSAIAAAVRAHEGKGRYPSSTIYGDGRAGERIARLLATAPLSIEKRIRY